MTMMRIASPALLLIALCALPGQADADVERLVGFGGFEVSGASMGGALGEQFSGEQRLYYSTGLKLNDLDLRIMVGGLDELTPTDPTLHGSYLSSFEFGASLRSIIAKPTPHFSLYVRGGLNRIWWSGTQEIRRTCAQTGDCIAGFKEVEPHFQGYSSRFGVGAEWNPLRPSAWTFFTISADVGYELTRMKIWNDYEVGHAISASVHIAIGAGKNGRKE